MIEVGFRIPDFSLPDQSGEEKILAELAGPEGLVLFAYPKDNTSG
jgi:thioredoxin-dependent peroxiredoxin